ncbi:hypothetical protein TWF281_005831 [Arthrobotrys megalospora]
MRLNPAAAIRTKTENSTRRRERTGLERGYNGREKGGRRRYEMGYDEGDEGDEGERMCGEQRSLEIW